MKISYRTKCSSLFLTGNQRTLLTVQFSQPDTRETDSAILAVSLIAKNRKTACENSTARSAPGLAVQSIMKHLVNDLVNDHSVI